MKEEIRGCGFEALGGKESEWPIPLLSLLFWLLITPLLHADSPHSTQFGYDGYEPFTYRINFDRAGYNEGVFKLQFSATAEGDYHIEEWVRPGSRYLGFQVTLEENDGKQVAVFQPPAPGSAPIRVARGQWGTLVTARGIFTVPGKGIPFNDATFGNPMKIAYLGNTITLEGVSATVQALSYREQR